MNRDVVLTGADTAATVSHRKNSFRRSRGYGAMCDWLTSLVGPSRVGWRQFQVAVYYLYFDSIRSVGIDSYCGQFVYIEPDSGPDRLAVRCVAQICASYIIFIIVVVTTTTIVFAVIFFWFTVVVLFAFVISVDINTPAVTDGRRISVSRLFRAIFLLKGINGVHVG